MTATRHAMLTVVAPDLDCSSWEPEMTDTQPATPVTVMTDAERAAYTPPRCPRCGAYPEIVWDRFIDPPHVDYRWVPMVSSCPNECETEGGR